MSNLIKLSVLDRDLQLSVCMSLLLAYQIMNSYTACTICSIKPVAAIASLKNCSITFNDSVIKLAEFEHCCLSV